MVGDVVVVVVLTAAAVVLAVAVEAGGVAFEDVVPNVQSRQNCKHRTSIVLRHKISDAPIKILYHLLSCYHYCTNCYFFV